ncbi:MAG: MFS transporter [Alphaproteobacteria bacterium]|nr:MFS transporter [Alphaproteobacteria bacterium]
MKNKKIFVLVVLGNIIDYYDFLLFAHLGYIITPFFIPNLSSTEVHLLSLLLFALPFVIRPIGGYIFGRMSDLKGRHQALTASLKWASIATFGLAFLPSYEYGGITVAVLFVFLRALQGLSLGGEYPIAGTYLMEQYKDNQGLISGILVASGTIGSLIAFSFAWLYINNYVTGESWRSFFIIGGIVTFASYFLRKQLSTHLKSSAEIKQISIPYSKSILTVLLIGIMVGLTVWLPMTYSNFYLTKILGANTNIGLMATLICLLLYIILNPFFGKISDLYSAKTIMTIASLIVIPLSCLGFYLIQQQNLWGQVFLTMAAACFGAPIHVLMNQLFDPKSRSRHINLLFMSGTAIGSLAPSLSGYLVDRYQIEYTPVIIVSCISFVTFIIFSLTLFKNKQLNIIEEKIR